MTDSPAPAATTTASIVNGKDTLNPSEASFLDAAAAAAEALTASDDVERQQVSQQEQTQKDRSIIDQPQQASAEPNTRDEETASAFTSDSYEDQKTTFQDLIISSKTNFWNDDNRVPFPSVNAPPEEINEVVNVCPCRCLFFTLKETICMVMSALGCAVFIAGLVFLCMFLEGSWFEENA